ncbi:galactosyl transferase GMA12/MNN10 family protein [Ophiocordyceps camponoti-floridani]|uniref:Galactosyl transferase GMA12/MNN10 family protein n=1 Tax=Ophiocordyceps camponoti-floridani TaxID=2030778 RepID=A0A8H4Q9J3_9HYPO|nr:galactosyl transferase GMA12/MNN10 family protein [Ophiocordyceps camponoti-floridani]
MNFTLVKIGAGIVTVVFLLWQLSSHLNYSYSIHSVLEQYRVSRHNTATGGLGVHGSQNCVSDIDTVAVGREAAAFRRSCLASHPARALLGQESPRVATVSVHFTEPGKDTYYQNAIRTHLLHRLVHESHLSLLCSPLVNGMWNKQAYLLSVMLEEMAKPADERLQWIFWADRDSIVVDPCRDVTDFLPQSALEEDSVSDKHQINLLIAKDWNGINAGIFLLRVGEWGIDFLNDVLSFPRFKPNVTLTFEEQSAMDVLLQEEKYEYGVRYVPQHWFNAYPNEGGRMEQYTAMNNTDELNEWAVRRGDFVVHFAGFPNKEEEINGYIKAMKKEGNVWESGRALRDVSGEVDEFWSNSSHVS